MPSHPVVRRRGESGALVEWTKENQSAAAYFTEVAGLRDDPVRLPEPTDVALIRTEVLARLYRMQKRHQADGRVLPRGEKIAPELAASGLLGPEMTTGFPGPLDRHVLPVQPVGPEVAQHFEGVRAEKGEKEYLSALAVLSLHFRLDADTMQRVHRNVRASLAEPLDEGARRAERESFPSVVMIAVSQRNVSLAKALGEALVRYSGTANRLESVGEAVGLLCQLAPSIEADDQRASWLQDRFKRVAETLPVEMLPDYLMSCVLSMSSCHVTRGSTQPRSGWPARGRRRRLPPSSVRDPEPTRGESGTGRLRPSRIQR